MSISDVTILLHAAHQGDRGAEEELFARLYGDLKRLARAQLARGGRPGGTLDTTVAGERGLPAPLRGRAASTPWAAPTSSTSRRG